MCVYENTRSSIPICFSLPYLRQCVPCPLDEMLVPPTTLEAHNDEKVLLEQLLSFLSGTDESELVELDRALGIDKIVQVSSSAFIFPSFQLNQTGISLYPFCLTFCLCSVERMPGSNHPALCPASVLNPSAQLPVPVPQLSFTVFG